MRNATLEPATDSVISLPVPGLTHALLAPAGADLAVATSWAPRLDGDTLNDATTAAVLHIDLPAGHPFWERAQSTIPGVAVAHVMVAGESPALHVSVCHAGHAPVTVLLDVDSCAAAALLGAAYVTGELELCPSEDASVRATAVPLPDSGHAASAVVAHLARCRRCTR